MSRYKVIRAAAASPAPTTELGSELGTGSALGWGSWSGGGDTLERVPELVWPMSASTYKYMLNDAQINSLYLGATLPIRSYNYYLEPNGSRPETVARISQNYNLPIGQSDPFNRRRGARRFSFPKHLEDALRFLIYGHEYFEQVGEIGKDGLWTLLKLALRSPLTLSEINVEDDGGLKSIRQMTGPDSPPIPVNRLVAYVWDREGANWAGRSLLRSIYRNHLVKDRVLRVGAINIERAGGVPYIEAPDGASGPQMRELDKLARAFRVGESAGASLPHGAQLKFASAAGGDGAVNYIKLQNEEMARGWLQMFQTLGTVSSAGLNGGSLGANFIDYFALAQETIAQTICDIFNEHVIEDDVEWNEGPSEEYAPLLKFSTANADDPAAGIDAALGQPDGIMDPNGAVKAMIHGRRRPHLRVAPARGSSAEHVDAQAAAPSPVVLPARPLRRQPSDNEIRAAVDFAQMDSTYQSALDLLVQEVRVLQQHQVQELHDGIIEASASLDKLAVLSCDTIHSEVISAQLLRVSELAMTQAVQEASRQGVALEHPDTAKIAASLKNRAEAVDKLLASNLAQTASRNAVRLTGGALDSEAVAASVKTYLQSLSGAYLNDVLGGAIQQAVNSGRKLVFARDPEGELYASELLDDNTCSACAAVDGTQYASLDDAEQDYPTGGYSDCEGRERCRGTLIKVYSTEADSTSQEAFA